KRGGLREDFFYRIHILPVYLPPLRERKDDIPLLIDYFLHLHDKKHPPLPGNIIEALQNYDWPGNVRELQNVLHRYLTLKRLDFAGLPKTRTTRLEEEASKDEGTMSTGFAKSTINTTQTESATYNNAVSAEESKKTLKASEKEIIMKALSENNWHRSRTAEALGIDRKTLFRKMQNFGLDQP
ncbi:MAG: helix-turn-helix domain-containing protein, partial [Smithella sp.]